MDGKKQMRRKADGAIFDVRQRVEPGERVRVGDGDDLPGGSMILAPVDGGEPTIVYPGEEGSWEEHDPAAAASAPPVEYFVVVKMKGGRPPFMAHVPLEGDDVAKLGRKAAVEITVDSLTVRDHREIETVYVTTLDQMEQTEW